MHSLRFFEVLFLFVFAGSESPTLLERLQRDAVGASPQSITVFYQICEIVNEGQADWWMARERGAPADVIADTANTAARITEGYRRRLARDPDNQGLMEAVSFYKKCTEMLQPPPDLEKDTGVKHAV